MLLNHLHLQESIPFLPFVWEHLTNEGAAPAGKSIHVHPTALTASAPIAHLFPSTTESFCWWAEKSWTLCVQYPAAEEALALLLLALLFSSNKKVVMTHSIKKQKQSCNLLKDSCLDAEH